MNYGEVFAKTYRGKKVLLTGHTGFKGSWLLVWLHQLRAIVQGYALSPENPGDLYYGIAGDKLCNSLIADIRDKEKLRQTISDFKPDFIFHLAAQPLVRRSYEMPLYTWEVNVNGTAHVFEAIRGLAHPCCVVVVTTDKVYENREADYAYKETDKLGGYDPYSASKAAAEIVVDSYRNSFFNPGKFKEHQKAIATARAGNVIGGGDWAQDRIMPDIARALKADETIIVRNPLSIRPWQHVLEPLAGYLLLGAKLHQDPVKYTGSWNFGPLPGDVLTVEELVRHAIQSFGSGHYEFPVVTDQPHEAGLLKLDITKAIQELGWKPKMNAAEAIQQTVDWYKHVTTGSALQFLQQQILQYQQAS